MNVEPGSVLLPEHPVETLAEYVQVRGGGTGLARARELGPDGVIDALTRSGLRGRGGAGFPVGRKWATVRGGGPAMGERYVVANGAEGEPGTFKDRALMQANPYQILEGLLIAADTVGAAQALVAVKASFTAQIAALTRAIGEMQDVGMFGPVTVSIVTGPEEYLFGEEKALLEVIEGEDPLPRTLPPYLYGLFTTGPQMGWSAGGDRTDESVAQPQSNPTLVTNVETLANVPVILSQGPDWHRSLGTTDSPGVVICTVVGDVQHAGVGEVELGTPLSEVLVGLGGGVGPGRHLKAVLSGVSNPVLTATQVETPLSYEAMAQAGSGLGSCGFMVFDDHADMAAVARMVSRFLYVESCGQCPACKFGTGEVTAYLDRITRGIGAEHDFDLIGARLTTVTDANRCALGAQEQRVIRSILQAFPDDFVTHLENTMPAADMLIPKLVSLEEGVAIYDRLQGRKRPDWTYPQGTGRPE